MPNNRIEKECKKHGICEFVLENNGRIKYYRCVKCRCEKVKQRRRNIKQILVQEHGGKCKVCGYNKCVQALEFHHVNPADKSFGISAKGNTIAIDRVRKEADKCILLCSNCHVEVENGIVQL